MNLKYTYIHTPVIRKHLFEIEVAKRLLLLLPLQPHREIVLRRQTVLKSSLYSARIEGNPLKLSQIHSSLRNEPSREHQEVFNIVQALEWIFAQKGKIPLTALMLRHLHEMVMKSLDPQPGEFRSEPSAIFNQAGIAIYLAPPPSELPSAIATLIEKLSAMGDSGPIQAAYAHYAFEKIHPFLDGNGRVGRLLATVILKNTNYDFRGLISLEEDLEKKRQIYYDLLALPSKDITQFIEFMLEGIKDQANKMTSKLRQQEKEMPEDRLLPRRREILEIIRDHELVTFDFLKRRFVAISESMLHHDLRQLAACGLIKKLGTTRGALYTT